MMTAAPLNIYEYLDQNGNPDKFICDGHIDSVAFRDKCFQDYYVRPLVVRHQWQKTRRIFKHTGRQKKLRNITETVYIASEEMGCKPVTVGLVS